MPYDASTWLYSGDPLKSDRDEIRFLIGDTKPDRPLLGDTEIDGAIGLALQQGAPTDDTATYADVVVTSAAHTLPLSTATLSVNGTTAAGADTINLDASSVKGALQPGTVLRFDGQSTRYTVRNLTLASNNALSSVTFWPGLTAAVTDNTAVFVRLYNIKEAAALCCETLARQFATEVDETVDGRARHHSQKAANFLKLAADLRAQAARSRPGGIGIPTYRT